MTRRITLSKTLAILSLSTSCQTSEKNALLTRCVRGHYQYEYEDVRDMPHRIFVCDEVMPLVRWEKKIYRLGQEYLGRMDLGQGEKIDLGNSTDHTEVP